ncbi:outer membrane beta-barrel protein [Bradyrhizobium sediminis]|uniref:Outer membrane beta-barrel protein n=2 Tax=Bradyrhizobium sediminis TaxID=2840469 RepID=A0A975P2U6_9BRAD|nr:outer membrane beta-barrel protein [Bradyrhizobium sediminis]
MAVKARPVPPPVAVYNWTGFYVGINGGGGSAHKCWDLINNLGVAVVPAVPEGCHNATGGTIGGQIGYRWQASNWVFGLEAQGNWADFTGSNSSLFFADVTDRTKVEAFGLFTGQIGYAINNLLLYVKGGAAVASDKYNTYTTSTGVGIDSGSETRWGGVVGAGVEFGFAPNWSVAFEYDHLFMGTRDVSSYLITTGALSAIDRISQDVDIGTVRINYRFGGPVVAKY